MVKPGNERSCSKSVKWQRPSHKLIGKENTRWLGKTPTRTKYLTHWLKGSKCQKYYSIILEQLSVVTRSVIPEELAPIKEHFKTFLVAEKSTRKSVSSFIVGILNEQNIPFQDCRGQSYNPGANIKNKGNGARLLQHNSRAFSVPNGDHTVNLGVADAASDV